MKMKYSIVTLCGSTRFKEEFMQVQKQLTLEGHIVISVGLFGHSGDKEVWEGLNEDTTTSTKRMLDDMHKAKIDMAEEIFVVNPGGYIGESTWSEICYARMTGKRIKALETISESEIDSRVREHVETAKALAYQQYDAWLHLRTDYADEGVLLKDMTVFPYKGSPVLDPWMQAADDDPFVVYGKETMARFIEEIIMRERAKNQAMEEEREAAKRRPELIEEIREYCEELGIGYPKGFPEEMSNRDMERWIETWSEYDPCPELNKPEVEHMPDTYEKLVDSINDALKNSAGEYHELFGEKPGIALEEANAWTYWQGRGNRHPRIMIVGQDWGSLEEKDTNQFFEAIDEMIRKGKTDEKVHYFDKFPKGFIDTKGFATDRKLAELFTKLGDYNIFKKAYPDVFFTNLIPGYRKTGNSTGGFRTSWVTEKVKADFKALIAILRPQAVLCLGKDTFVQAAAIFGYRAVLKGTDWNGYLDRALNKDSDEPPKPLKINKESGEPSYLFALPHPGFYGTNNRGEEVMEADWEKVGKWLKGHEKEWEVRK